MKSHGGQPSLDWPNCMQYFRLAVIGAGAAAPTAPTGTLCTLSGTSPDYPKKANALSTLAAEIPTRSGVGAYVVTYDAGFTVPKILNAPIEVYGAAGMWASVTSINIATRQLTITTYAAAGAATDLPNGTSIMVISCECQDSTT